MSLIKLFKEKILNSKEHNVFPNMLILFLGTGSFKAISLLVMPILTRIYSPEDFGLLSIYTSISFLCASLISLRYHQAIPLPKYDNQAINIFALSVILNIVLIIFLSVILLLFGSDIFKLFKAEEIIPYSWLILLGIFALGSFDIISSWGVRKKNFKAIAKNQVYQGIIGNTVKLVLGLLSLKPLGLMFGHFILPMSGATGLSIFFFKDLKKQVRKISIRGILSTARRYQDFPKFHLLSTFLNMLSSQLPALFIIAWYGFEVAGQFALTVTALSTTVRLLGASTSKAYFGEISQIGKQNPHKIKKVTLSVMKHLIVISLACSSSLFIFGPFLFSVLFGENWLQAGVFARILSISLAFQFIIMPLTDIFTVYNKLKQRLFFNMFRTCLVTIAFVMGHYWNWSPEQTLLSYSLIMALFFSFLLYYIFHVLNDATDYKSQVTPKE